MKCSFLKKTASLVLVFSMVLSSFASFPHRAQAVLPVVETGPQLFQSILNTINTTFDVSKNSILDGIAWGVAKTAIRSMTRSLVTWINSGFEGSPAFATNFREELLRTGDRAVANFLDAVAEGACREDEQVIQNEDGTETPRDCTIIYSPWLETAAVAAVAAYYVATEPELITERLRYRLHETLQNDRAFLAGDFSQGGWRGWYEVTQNRANNPFGTALEVRSELQAAVDDAISDLTTELGWNDGFFSWKTCARRAEPTQDEEGSPVQGECLEEGPTQTPGGLIEDQLATSFGSDIDQLEIADEINEVISALVGQMINQVFGGQGGLFGASDPRPGRPSFRNNTAPEQTINNSLSAQFIANLGRQERQIETNRTNWTTVRDAALRAQTALSTCEEINTPERQAQVQGAIQTTEGALSRAQTALAEVSRIRLEAEASQRQPRGSAPITELSNAYTAFLASEAGSRLAEDTANALQESRTTQESNSLLVQMQNIEQEAQTRCRIRTNE